MPGASQFMFGSGLLYGTRTDTANNTPRLFGTMQDVSIDFDGEIKELFGQFTFPVDVARGKTKISGKAKFATVAGEIYNDLFFGQTLNAGQASFAYQEAHTIPTTPYQVTVTHSALTPLTDLGVTYQATGVALTEVASAPVTGQYSQAAGVYTFAAADTTLGVFINYIYTEASSGTQIVVNNPFMGTTPRFSAVFAETFESQQVVFTLLNCVASKLMFSTKIDDYTIPEMDFSAFANAAGNVGTLSFAN
jgi:hypothetical protein